MANGIASTKKGSVTLIPGTNDPELTDAIEDYYLPVSVRNNLSKIKTIQTYNDLKKYLQQEGVELDTDVAALKESKGDDVFPAVTEQAQKIATVVETYKAVFGDDSLKELKRVKLYDKNLDTPGAFHYNEKGENDPLAGTMRLRDWNVSGHVLFHELAHALQASKAKNNEDPLSYSDRAMKKYKKKLDVSYTGHTDKVKNAETMAEALAYGFTTGGKQYSDFIGFLKKQK